jgi:hypothetical protein
MRRLFVLAIAAASALACTEEDPPPLYVDVDYQVRCIDCEPRAADDAARDIRAIDGELGFSVECSVTERGGDRLLTFRAIYTDAERASRSYGISLVQANVEGGDPGGSCLVVVTEGSNTYEGDCSADEPDEESPCQVELEAEDGIVVGSILCEGVPNKNSSMSTRHVVDPNSEDPAKFEVHGCRNL